MKINTSSMILFGFITIVIIILLAIYAGAVTKQIINFDQQLEEQSTSLPVTSAVGVVEK